MTDEHEKHLISGKVQRLLLELGEHDQRIVADILLLAAIRAARDANPDMPLTQIAKRAILMLNQEYLL